jgi:hypothetical protein
VMWHLAVFVLGLRSSLLSVNIGLRGGARGKPMGAGREEEWTG